LTVIFPQIILLIQVVVVIVIVVVVGVGVVVIIRIDRERIIKVQCCCIQGWTLYRPDNIHDYHYLDEKQIILDLVVVVIVTGGKWKLPPQKPSHGNKY
jgi:hypothetical protein